MNTNCKTVRQEVADFMEAHPVLTKLKGDAWYSVEDGIVALIESITGSKDTAYETPDYFERGVKYDRNNNDF